MSRYIEEEIEDLICPHCNGSGEGQFDGTHCISCKGSGVEQFEFEDESFDALHDELPDEYFD